MIRYKQILATAGLLLCCFASFSQAVTNRGKEFWVGYGHHHYMETGQGEAPVNSQDMVLYLSAEQAANVTVTIDSSSAIPTLWWKKTYSIPGGNVITTVPLPKGAQLAYDSYNANYDARLYTDPPPFVNSLGNSGGEGIFRGKGIHITSDVPIVAYAHIYSTVSSGATMLLPIETWGYSYTTINPKQAGASFCFNWVFVIAKEDNTVVEITPSQVTRLGKPAGVPFTVNLQKGQIYQIIGQADVNGNGVELTGTKVKSIAPANGAACKPIAVFAGSSRTSNPACGGSGGSRDNNIQQCFPQHAWGKKFLTSPHMNSNGYPNSFQTNPMKIVVMDPTTIVKRNGTVLTNVVNNAYYFESSSPDYIEADKPVMVAELMSSNCLSGDGDPDIVYLTPMEQGIKRVGFYRNSKTAINTVYVNIIVPNKGTGLSSLRIDGSSTFDRVITHPQNSNYSIVIKRWSVNNSGLNVGQCIVLSDSAFTAVTYGLGGAESYSYNAGCNLINLNGIGSVNNVLDTSNGGNNMHDYTAVNTPTKISILMRYQPTTLLWKFNSLAAGVVTPNNWPSPPHPAGQFLMDPASNYLLDSPTVNGLKYYRYVLPDTFKFAIAGTYTIPVESHSPGIDNCGNKEDLTAVIEVKPQPLGTHGYVHSTLCTKDTIYLTGPSATTIATSTVPVTQWRWYLGTSLLSNAKDTAIVLPVGSYSLKLESVTNNGILLSPSTRTFNVVNVPSASLSGTPDTVCLGQTITFGQSSSFTGSVPINNYTWNLSDGSGTQTGASWTNITKTYATSGTYKAWLLVKASTLCVSDTAFKTVQVNDKAVIGFIYPQNCLPPSGIADFQANSTAQGGQPITSYAWTFGDPSSGSNNAATGSTVSHTYSTPGQYPVHLSIVTNTGCSGDTTININANIKPGLTFSAINPVCRNAPPVSVANASVTNGVPGTGYYYDASGSTTNTGTFNPTAAGVGNHTIWYVFTATTGCKDSTSQTITVSTGAAKPTVTTPVSYCQGAATTALVASGDAGNTIKYYDNAALTNGVTSAPTPSSTTPGTFYYYVTQTTPSGCESDTSIITVIITPSISNYNIGSDQTICSSTNPAALDATSTIAGGNGTYTYQWQQSTDNTNWNTIPGVTNASYTPAALSVTTYFRRIVTSGLCSATSGSVTINVTPAITNFNIASDQAICAGMTPAPITGQTPAGAGSFTYTWESSPDNSTWSVITGVTGVNYQPGPITTTTYYRRKVVNGPCSATSNYIKITVNPLANGSISAPAGICQDASADITFIATTGTAPFSIYYTIQLPGGGSNSYHPTGLANNAIIPIIPAGSTPGTYTVKLDSITHSANTCVTTTGLNTVTIVVTAKPVVGVTISPSATVCEGVPVTLTATGGTTYSWTGNGLTSNSGSTVTATPAGNGVINYSVTATNNNCSTTKDTSITVIARPAKPTVSTPVTYCQNASAVSLVATAAGSNTLTWYNNAALTGGSASAPTPSTATAGTFLFYVTQTNSNNCVSDTSVITVTVQPSIANNTIAADQTICEGSSAVLLNSSSSPTGGSGVYTYQWEQSTVGSGWTAITGATSTTYPPGILSVTTQFRRIVSSGLCSNTSNPVTVTVVPAITNYNISADQTICEGNTPNPLTGQTPPGAGPFTYLWEQSTNGGSTWTTTGATGVNYSPGPLSTTTKFRRTVTNGPCSASSTVEITVNSLANGTISGPTAICQYQTAAITFNSTVGTAPFTIGLSVTDPSGATTNLPPQTVNSGGTVNVIPLNSAAGNYTITLTSLTNSNGCVRTTGLNNIVIAVTATPSVQVNVSGQICEGFSATLTTTGATSYSWTGPNLSSTSGASVTANPPTAGSYNYTVTGTTNGCNGTGQATLVVNPKPAKPSVVTPVSYCQLGTAVPLQATANGSNTLKWYNNPALTGGVTSAPTPSTINAGTFYYYVTQTNNFSCESDTSITTIIVNPGINGNSISADQSICQGSTPASLTNAGTLNGGNGTYTYQWQQSTDGGTNWNDISGATTADYAPGILNTTTKYRRLVTSVQCGSVSNIVTVTVLIGLGNYDISADQIICEATQPAQLNGQSTTGTGPFIYTWQQSIDNSNWTDIPSSNTLNYLPPVLNVTTYYRRKVTNGPCTAYSSVATIIVNPLANGTISAPASICEYENADVTFTSTIGTAPFTIGLSITNPSGSTSALSLQTVNSGGTVNVIPVNSAPGTYTITLTSLKNSNGCVRTTGLNSVTVIVKPRPVINIPAVTPVCKNDSAAITANGATTYTWSGPGLASTTANPVKALPLSTSTYTVTGTTNGCSSLATVSVTVNPRPIVHISVAKNEICITEQGIFSATSTIDSGNITGYHWDFDNGNTSASLNPPAQTYSTHRVYTTTLYAVSDKNCVGSIDTAYINVNPLPVANFTVPAFVCLPNNVATFQNQSSIPNGAHLDYLWNFGDPASGALNNSTATNGTHIYPDSAKYTITLSVVSAQGCSSQVVKTFDAFFRKPIAKFGVTPDTLCQGIQNLFMDSSFAPGSNILKRLWLFGDGNSLNDSTNAAKIYTRPGNYKVKLVVQNSQGCTSDTAYKNVIVYLQPVIDAGPSFVVPSNTTVTFNATANSNALQFAWTSPTGGIVSNPAILKPQYIAVADGKFILTATGQGNCKASDSITVKVLHPIAIPNAFSPNGDGINDKWTIANLADYPNCVVEVYNRYGQSVYKSFGYTKAWDGTINGKPLPVGTYYYIIEPKNGFPTVTGYVIIVR